MENSNLEIVKSQSQLRKETTTLAAAVELYLNKVRRDNAPRTLKSYREAVFSFLKFAGSRDIKSTNPKDWMFEMVDVIEGWRRSLVARSFARTTVQNYDNKLSMFFGFCYRYDIITHNPYNLIASRPAQPTRRYPLFTADDYELMKKQGLGKPRYYYLTVLGYNTGMSLIDCCLLDWSMIDMNACLITKVRHKTLRFGDACTANIPIKPGGDLYQLLIWMRDKWDRDRRNKPEYVFPELAEFYMRDNINVTRTFSRFVQVRCGMEDRCFSTFRRTWMSIMANSNANIALAMKMSGHVKPETFAKYVQVDLKSLHDTMHKAMVDAKTMKFSYDPALDGDDTPKFIKRRPTRARRKHCSESNPFGRTITDARISGFKGGPKGPVIDAGQPDATNATGPETAATAASSGDTDTSTKTDGPATATDTYGAD